MIESRVKAVVAITLGWRRHKILQRHIAIRQRIKDCDCASDSIDAHIRNNSARKGHAGKWVYWSAKQALGEITGSFERGRNVGDARDAFQGASAFVVAKEKGAIVFNRSAKGTAKLVAQVFGFRLFGRGKEVSRIEGAVAVKLKQRAMNIVTA